MLDALDEAQELVEKKLIPAYNPIQGRLINSHYLLPQEGRAKTIEYLTQARDRLQTDIWPAINDFVYQKYSAYRDQMRIALALDQEAAKGELTRSIQHIIDVLNKFPDTPDKWPDKQVEVVDPDFKSAEQQGNLY